MVDLQTLAVAIVYSFHPALQLTLAALPLMVLGRHLFLWLRARNWTWARSVFFTLFILAYASTLLLVLLPFAFSRGGEVDFVAVQTEQYLLPVAVIASALAVIPRALVLALLFMPLTFLGDLAYSYVEERTKMKGLLEWLAPLAVSTYAGSYAFVVLSRLVEWVYPMVVYVVYQL